MGPRRTSHNWTKVASLMENRVDFCSLCRGTTVKILTGILRAPLVVPVEVLLQVIITGSQATSKTHRARKGGIYL